MKRFLAATALGALALSASAQPWDGSAVDKVKTLDVTASENFGFRDYCRRTSKC